MPTIATAGFAAALFSLSVVVIGAAGQVVAHHRAQVAADLAAVAGAHSLWRGEDACSTARWTAALNGETVGDCTVTGADVTVTVPVRGREVRATAGPL